MSVEPPHDRHTAADHHRAVHEALVARARRLLRDTARRTGLLGLVAAGVLAPVDAALALGIVAGLILGLAHLALLSRTAARLAAGAAAFGSNGDRPRSFVPFFWLKWPLWALALGGVLWYMRARPEGVAAGLILSLAVFAVSSRKHVS